MTKSRLYKPFPFVIKLHDGYHGNKEDAATMDTGPLQRRNFVAFLIHALFLALTLNFIDINTVVPNMLAQAGGTALHMGILSAIMIGGTRFMQLLFAGMIVPLRRKKPALLAGIYIRVAALVVLGFFIKTLSEPSAVHVWTIIMVMTVFSFSGAYANIAYTDIMGKVIIAEKRKRLLVIKQLLSSIGVIVSALVVKIILSEVSYPANYSLLFLLGGILLLLGTVGFWMIIEQEGPGTTRVLSGGQFARFSSIIRSDANLRRYLLLINTTGVVVSTLPFLLLYARTRFPVDGSMTGTFLLVQMIGALGANLLLSLFSKDQKYRPLLYLFIATSAITPIMALLVPASAWWYAPVFLLSGIAHTLNQIVSSGVLLEISTDENRAIYTGISGAGSVMQVLYPLLFGLLAGSLGYAFMLIATSLYMCAGLFAAKRLSCERLNLSA